MKIIEPLNKSHDRERFDCGTAALNQFLRATARQHIQKGISRTFVLSDRDCPQNIIGFFTLTLCEISSEKLPSSLAKKYPLQIPGVKLARLAVDLQWQRQGIGEILMVEAMQRALLVADTAGGIGLFVDAKNESAQSYYARYGFIALEDNPLEMFLPLSLLRTLNLDR
ncbi:GNAT family N-acetyltransferase [Chamaesiphon sp. OTE_20_metabat_361]|uniref:GNAT family N-acetyltransferase n=1 Tax=Chamaesiphon sp. OTE_20_metabat_361 TaxID=2964689 RepID=UPI00286A13EB|nr:GNAT family N-acetyltransferase [Chamaesiphon sp. OTE_20_metabat_361]